MVAVVRTNNPPRRDLTGAVATNPSVLALGTTKLRTHNSGLARTTPMITPSSKLLSCWCGNYGCYLVNVTR